MFDTKTFNKLSDQEYKRQTQRHWSGSPCGSNTSEKQTLTKEYFDDVEAYRYRTHPWILKNIEQFDIKGKKVLEIGYGMGTDHLALARRGAIMHGIDITQRNFEITSSRFALYGESSGLVTGDAEHLPYEDNSLDFVYSFGVIHHTPRTDKVIAEIYRVLKPGGKCWITVYHRNSVFFWWSVLLWKHVIRQRYWRYTLRQELSFIEYPGDNPNLVIRLYGREEFAQLFRAFTSCTASVEHLLPGDIAVFGRFVADRERPRPFFDRAGKRWGWYVVAEAQK
jgi:ubiquinone/menaquinone biosynthesis C-methylase UbiE